MVACFSELILGPFARYTVCARCIMDMRHPVNSTSLPKSLPMSWKKLLFRKYPLEKYVTPMSTYYYIGKHMGLANTEGAKT